VHSEYQFRRSVANRTVDEDLQRLSTDDQLPEFETGFFRLPDGEPFVTEKVVCWMGAGTIAFSLVCDSGENRILAESVLKLIIRFMQDYLRVMNQPTEVCLKADRVGLILSRFLPDGNLIFMNNRVIRQLEKEVDILMKQ
jgi:AP-5 complex subunit sigma-1